METHLLLIPLSIVSLIACRIVAMLRPGLNLKAKQNRERKRHHAVRFKTHKKLTSSARETSTKTNELSGKASDNQRTAF